MKPVLKVMVLAAGLVVVAGGVAGLVVLAYFIGAGVSARPAPGRVETFVARNFRDLAIAWHTQDRQNPVPLSEQIITAGREHFADHCASCHANDGSGEVELGRGLYPRAPDMRLPATQQLSDEALFYIIENGVRLTGMPAWGTGTPEGEAQSWHLVHFIRQLPQLTVAEIEQMQERNPRSPAEIRQEIEAERFLRGEAPDSAAPADADGHGHE